MTIVIALALTFIFALGLLLGSSMNRASSRLVIKRQMAQQRSLNEQWAALRRQQESAAERMRWLAKQQSGMKVVDYDEALQHTRHARRSA